MEGCYYCSLCAVVVDYRRPHAALSIAFLGSEGRAVRCNHLRVVSRYEYRKLWIHFRTYQVSRWPQILYGLYSDCHFP